MNQRVLGWVSILVVVGLSAPARAFQLVDSLQGSTAGNLVGGSLGPNGWTVTARTDRLWYAIPRLVSGSVQFTITNASLANLTVEDNELFAMYEAGHGISEPINYNPEYRNNYYKCMIRVYGTQEPARTGQQKLIWGVCNAGAPGYGDGCPCSNGLLEEPFGGDPTWDGSPVTFKVEWGGGHAKLYRNGSLLHDVDYSSAGAFGPQTQHFSLGSSRSDGVASSGLPIGAVFSNVIVEGTEGAAAPTCSAGTGGSAGSGGGTGGNSSCDAGAPLGASLTPNDGKGNAAVFRTTYSHCEGASSLRVVQLWVTDSIDAGTGVSVGYENGTLYGAGSSEQCAPGDTKTLAGPYGSLDCAKTTVSSSGGELLVDWALEFDVDAFAGTHGVWVDAKGGSAEPEPRLGWTKLGDFTVSASDPSWSDGGVDSGSGGSPSAVGRGEVKEDGGCGCRATGSSAPSPWFGVVVGLFAAARRRRRSLLRVFLVGRAQRHG